MDFVDRLLNGQEYRIEDLPEYKYEDIYGDNYIDESDHNINKEDISGNNMAGDSSVSSNSVSSNSVSDNFVPGSTFTTVGDEYFSDALFIGDSRTVGLQEYSDLEQADYFAATGLTIYKVLESEIVMSGGNNGKMTIDEVLQQKQYGKIYIMLGINEMGRGNVDSFIEKYIQVINHLRELQPGAIIFVQGIMMVSDEYSGLSDYIHNQGIDERNDRLAGLADGQQIFYLDVNPVICDESGGLNDNYTTDGVHLKAEHIGMWTDFLKANGIVK